MPVRRRLFSWMLWFYLVFSLDAQTVVFSRRVYQERGLSYQQIWSWNPATGELKPLTNSSRDHYRPGCGNGTITFISPAEFEPGAKRWSFDSGSGKERVIGPAPSELPPEPLPAKGCEVSATAGDLEACSRDEQDLFLSRAGKGIGHFRIEAGHCLGKDNKPVLCQTPIQSLAWSPDRKRLLVGEQGLDDNSTARQDDYYVVDIASMKIEKAASAEDMFWLPSGDQLLYITPKNLTSLPGARRARSVWTQQLMLFNAAAETDKAITSGITNNVDASLCHH